MVGAGVEGGFQRYPPSLGVQTKLRGIRNRSTEHTFTLEEFPGWAPWSWLLPWRVGPKANNLETQAGITDFHVFLLTLGRQVIRGTQHPWQYFCMGRHFRNEEETGRVDLRMNPTPSCLTSRPAYATMQTTEVEREEVEWDSIYGRTQIGETRAQRWLTVCTSFRGQLLEDHRSQRLS